jgi:hypothetical protein
MAILQMKLALSWATDSPRNASSQCSLLEAELDNAWQELRSTHWSIAKLIAMYRLRTTEREQLQRELAALNAEHAKYSKLRATFNLLLVGRSATTRRNSLALMVLP